MNNHAVPAQEVLIIKTPLNNAIYFRSNVLSTSSILIMLPVAHRDSVRKMHLVDQSMTSSSNSMCTVTRHLNRLWMLYFRTSPTKGACLHSAGYE